jgi:aspartyl-tRNA(Asn)/glutamyl-tRNA(Gln) amidotransferase subunit B
MEEDTGKLIHEIVNGEKVSLIDFNRSGVPLVEIVTEPDFENAIEVKEYLQKLQQIVRYLDVANADMEKGEMRLEPNISLRIESSRELPNYKVEVKNINSFSFVEKAINYEIKRQEVILRENKVPAQETRGWDDRKGQTVSQRSKEEASDYRYFPEPDIPPIQWEKEKETELKSQMPELPNEKFLRLQKEYELSAYNAELISREKDIAAYFEQAVADGIKLKVTPKEIANFIINQKIDSKTTVSAELIKKIIDAKQKVTLGNDELNKIIDSVLSKNVNAVTDYKKGKINAIMFLLGQVMREAKQKLDTKTVKEKLEEKLKG